MTHSSKAWLHQAAGWALILLGVLGWVVPIMPGWVFIGAGALLLAPYVRAFRRLAALIHVRFPALRTGLRRFRAIKPRPRAAPPGGPAKP